MCQISALSVDFHFHQLLSAADGCWQLIWKEKNLTGIFMYTLKLVLVPNFISLAWFLFLSAVKGCHQVLTADDSCYEKKLNGIFIYLLKLIFVPNFSFLGWFSFSSTVISCWQMLTTDDSWYEKKSTGIFCFWKVKRHV